MEPKDWHQETTEDLLEELANATTTLVVEWQNVNRWKVTITDDAGEYYVIKSTVREALVTLAIRQFS